MTRCNFSKKNNAVLIRLNPTLLLLKCWYFFGNLSSKGDKILLSRYLLTFPVAFTPNHFSMYRAQDGKINPEREQQKLETIV